jgi:hypothetical protein
MHILFRGAVHSRCLCIELCRATFHQVAMRWQMFFGGRGASRLWMRGHSAAQLTEKMRALLARCNWLLGLRRAAQEAAQERLAG